MLKDQLLSILNGFSWINDETPPVIIKFEEGYFYYLKNENWHTAEWNAYKNDAGDIIVAFPGVRLLELKLIHKDDKIITFAKPEGTVTFRRL